MSTSAERRTIAVINSKGLYLSHCTWKKASVLLHTGRAIRINATTIKLKQTKQERRENMRNIISESNRVCYICGKQIPEDERATIDHVVPRSKSNMAESYDNMLCCCERCNLDKQNRMPRDYILHILDNRDKYDYLSDERIEYLMGLFHHYESKFKNKSQTKKERKKERLGLL